MGHKGKKEYFIYIAKGLARRAVGYKSGFLPDPFSELLEAVNQNSHQKIFIFPETLDYTYMKQRPQQLVEAISKLGHLVFYGTRNYVSDEVAVSKKINSNLYLVNSDLFVSLAEFLPKNARSIFAYGQLIMPNWSIFQPIKLFMTLSMIVLARAAASRTRKIALAHASKGFSRFCFVSDFIFYFAHKISFKSNTSSKRGIKSFIQDCQNFRKAAHSGNWKKNSKIKK